MKFEIIINIYHGIEKKYDLK